jgi:hypothetical protein
MCRRPELSNDIFQTLNIRGTRAYRDAAPLPLPRILEQDLRRDASS